MTKTKRKPRKKAPVFIRPEVIYDALSPVVGQLDLRRKLAAAVSQYTAYRLNPAVGRPLVLIYGPSGTGKTFSGELISKEIGLPFTTVAAPSLSMSAFKGQTFRDLLTQHIMEFKTDEGIIFVDEIDKWCKAAIGGDQEIISQGLRLQGEALTMLTANKAVLMDEMEPDENETTEDITFNTSRTMWILAGAFTGIDRFVTHRLHNYNIPPEDIFSEVTPTDLETYGMSRELVGRIQTFAWVRPLTPIEMVEILTAQEIPKWKAMFDMVGTKLDLQPSALHTCAERARQENTGVRGAAAYLRRGMEDIYHSCSTHHVEAVTVSRIHIETGMIDLEAAS
jgi:ATP-dependent Clp protease ATP-binding subunit ClpX